MTAAPADTTTSAQAMTAPPRGLRPQRRIDVPTCRGAGDPREAERWRWVVLAAVVVGACGGGGGTEDWVVLDVYREGDTWYVEYKPPDRHRARTAVGTGVDPSACAMSATKGELVPDCVHEIRALNDESR